MIVRKYRASDMAAAVRQIRDDLGSDAVIIDSKHVRDGWIGWFGRRQVEVIAVIEGTANRVVSPPADLAVSSDEKSTINEVPDAIPAPMEAPSQAILSATDDVEDNRMEPPQAILSGPDDAEDSRTEPQTEIPVPPAYSESAVAPGPSGDGDPGNIRDEPEAGTPTVPFTQEPRSVPATEVLPPEPAVTAAMREMRSHLRDLRSTVERLAHQGTTPVLEGSPILRGMYEHLLNHELDPSLALEVVSEAGTALSDDGAQDLFAIRGSVADQLKQRLPVGGALIPESDNEMSPASKPKIIFLVGPTGVGKTTTIAKLVSHYVLDRKCRVGLLSTDTYRIGATSQLDTYASIVGQALRIAYAPGELTSAVAEMSDYSLLLVDTPGCAQQNDSQIEELAAFIASVSQREVHLCVSSSTKIRDMMDIAGGFGRLSFDRIILTKLDETTIYGPMISFVHRRQIPVSYLSTGQQVPEDLEVATSERLADLVLEDV